MRTPLCASLGSIALLLAVGGCPRTEDDGLSGAEAGVPGGMGPVDAALVDAPEQQGCDGPACKHLTLGMACTAAADCESGSCSDGVCCNVPCAGACVRCDQAASPGQCLPVAPGQSDPRGICHDDGVASCGLTGGCNGQGACARYAAGSACRPSACAGGSMVPAGSCDGRGSCLEGPAIACDPFMCGGGACLESCAGDADCVAPATCVGGSCGKRGLGQACQNEIGRAHV